MTWRVVESSCSERCDACLRTGSECDWRWCVVDDDFPPGVDRLVAYGFMSRAEAEAYVRYPETRQHPQPRH